MTTLPDLTISSLSTAYQAGELTPSSLVKLLHAKLTALEPSAVWIHLLSESELLDYARELETKDPADLPLYGVPFAIKDNIDLADAPTTAACPDFKYFAKESAFVVEQLIAAGAIPIGKTNLDQFATGLVGVRSPYGVPENACVPEYIPGGSSSGSAIAVAKGLVSFSLGTDTAGSGRVPASLNNIVGHKPTKGLLSCTGVIPACKSLDCVSIFANNAVDAQKVYDVASKFDPADPYAVENKLLPEAAPLGALGSTFRFGVPHASQLDFFGNEEAELLFFNTVRKLEAMGGEKHTIDFSPFLDAALLLYEGPWVAERYVAIEDIIQKNPEILHPVTRSIIAGGENLTAADAFKAEYKLKSLKRIADETIARVDFILTPTIGTCYTREEVEANPVELNSNLGYYTNFMNLLDFSATAFPAGFYKNKMPFGVTAFAPAFHDAKLLDLATKFMEDAPCISHDCSEVPAGWNPIVVCGAHLEGLALNWQLTTRNAKLWKKTQTAPLYQFFALPPVGDNIPPRPGVLRLAEDNEDAIAIEVEVWLIPTDKFGSFVANIPAPLGIGKVKLKDGKDYPGFICEPYVLKDPINGAKNISHLADWRKFIS
ncbi:allophanate hydrolase [Rubritalea spongiae]|uniref:Allophanate hydrolase n=1 Tax=Rubritalea spongiae TaxID=430797 RepID=A0ABW5DYY2_9BACT